MRKYIVSLAIAAAMAMPAKAEDYTPRDAISKLKKFENIAVIDQGGIGNHEAGVSQYGWNTFSATKQRGNGNTDGGVQINNSHGAQVRLVDQNGNNNTVMTFQEMGACSYGYCGVEGSYDKQLAAIKQRGNNNKAAVLQTKMIPKVGMKGHFVKKVGGYIDATKGMDVHGGGHKVPRHYR